MAIFTGLLKNIVGSAGQLTFKKVGDRTIVSEKVTTVKNSRTSAQQHQRMKWNNVLHFYQGILPTLKNAFEKKGANVSDYNCFVRVNNSISPVYLTKTESDGGACVAAPYQITQGSLPSIVISGAGAAAKTDIALGSLAIDANTTIADFSKAVVENNADYNYNDQISFYDILQMVNAETEIPYCRFAASYVILDKSSTVKLWDQVNKAGFAANGGYLAHGDDEGDGVFGWVHSIKEDSKTKVSTQFLIDNNALLASYTTESAYAKAANSYGTTADAFLDPDSESESSTTMYVSKKQSSGEDDSSETAQKVTLTLVASPEAGGTLTGAGEYTVGNSATVIASAASGYTFSRWSDNVTSASRTVTMDEAKTLTAYFTEASSSDGDESFAG